MMWLRRLLTGLVLSWAISASGAIYYVAPAGSDANPGSIDRPFYSISKGASVLNPGDTLYIRGGTYSQNAYASRSGTETAPITIAGYPGEEAVIDGGHTLPTAIWGNLLKVEGNYVIVRDLTIRRSSYIGLAVIGHHCQVLRVKAARNMENGILVTGTGSYSRVEDCEVYYNCMSNENFIPTRTGWATGLSSARGPVNVVLRGNKVWNNWGEGVSSYEAEHTVIEGNRIFDNQLNVYISDSRYCTVRSNIVYSTPGNPCASDSQIGIALGDERYTPASSDNTIVNNLLLGNAKNLYYWQGYAGGGLLNVVIAHNTFVNSVEESNLKIGRGTHTNVWIGNNVIVQDDALAGIVLGTAAGLTFSHNLWSKAPTSSAMGSGSLVGNPQLARAGSTQAGLLTAEWFRPSGQSPVRSAAVPTSNVTVDFWGVPRGNSPDVGAMEVGPQPPRNLRVVQY